MKSRDKLPSITPILIGFSLLLIGAAQITALWALTKVILPTSIKAQPNLSERRSHFRDSWYWKDHRDILPS
ncbi:MAG: hypothetical protein ACRC80_02140 [Waterburya sp.]